MKKVLLAGLVSAAIVSAGFLIQSASADNPGHQQGLEVKADILGLTVDELKNQLEDKNFAGLMQEQNIDMEQVHEKMLEKARERWQDRGLTDEEIAEREQRMQERFENCQAHCGLGPFMGQGFRGQGHHWKP